MGKQADFNFDARPNLPGLTSLRFFAAMVVVAFQYNLSHPISGILAGDFGYQAVTFFFVLTGFILVYAHGVTGGELNISWEQFITARLVRIGPSYYLAIGVAVSLFAIAGVLDRLTVLSTGSVVTMLQSWIPPFALALNPPAWSLFNEVFFYLIFLVLWSTTRHLSVIASLSAAAVLVAAAALLRRNISSAEIWNSFRLYFPLFNLPQFVLGMAIGYAFLNAP
jgi:peptidoglycan/LPS O-acetylase OafA/YrhL